MHLLVWRILGPRHPALRRAGRRADEEELLNIGRLQQLPSARLLRALDRGGLAKVDAGPHVLPVYEALCLEVLPDADGVVSREEGADDSAERR